MSWTDDILTTLAPARPNDPTPIDRVGPNVIDHLLAPDVAERELARASDQERARVLFARAYVAKARCDDTEVHETELQAELAEEEREVAQRGWTAHVAKGRTALVATAAGAVTVGNLANFSTWSAPARGAYSAVAVGLGVWVAREHGSELAKKELREVRKQARDSRHRVRQARTTARGAALLLDGAAEGELVPAGSVR